MAKRIAQTYLTDRNWDDEEEPEEAGVFLQASEDVISNRQIKKAKRRGIAGDGEGKPSSFSGFSGFALKANKPSDVAGAPLGLDSGKKATNHLFSMKTSDAMNGLSESNKKKSSQYIQDLKNLNESVLAWIKQHVEKNPFCILTPIFKDYEVHLADIEKSESDSTAVIDSENNKSASIGSEVKSEEKKAQTFSGIQFGTSSSSPAFSSFGGSSLSSTNGVSSLGSKDSFPGFSFKTTASDLKPAFSFASQCAQKMDTASSQSEKTEDEEYVPPEPEKREIKEDGEIYNNRCKLFYQKDNKWTERGVGNLHLKPVDDKLQLIVRADTNLGNIMLNIFLNSSIPLKKQGKNNVFFVCVPNPPINAKTDTGDPVPMLVRVKTSADADQLIKIIQDNIK